MPIKLLVQKDTDQDTDWQEEREFGQDIITIGRGSKSLLVLEDPKSIISRSHARLKLHEGIYYLYDNGSRNATYLNGQRISPEKAHRLNVDDVIKIGDYKITFQGFVTEDNHDDQTVMLINPFEEDVKIFKNVLKKIQRTYEDSPADARVSDLQAALFEMLSQTDFGPVSDILAESLFNARGAAQAGAPAPSSEEPPQIAEDLSASGESAAENGPSPAGGPPEEPQKPAIPASGATPVPNIPENLDNIDFDDELQDESPSGAKKAKEIIKPLYKFVQPTRNED